MAPNPKQDPSLVLEDEAREIGEVSMSPLQRARLGLAYWVLGGVAVAMLGAGAGVLYGPEGRLNEAKMIFEFAKTFGPPIITLIVGAYFRSGVADK